MNYSTIELLSLLAMAHFVGDFVLQSDRMAIEKCPGKDKTLHWSWWLTAHSSTHGLFVSLITGMPILGFCEFVAHFIIDWMKPKYSLSLSLDQSLHLLCKLIWLMFI